MTTPPCFISLCSHSVLPPDHTNPRFGFQPLLLRLLPRSTLALLFCFLWFPFGIVSSLEFLFCWFGGSVHGECWILGVTGADTGTLLGVLAVQCILLAAHTAWSLCADRWNFFFYCNLFVSEVPFECLFINGVCFVSMWSWNLCCQFNVCLVVLWSSKFLTFFYLTFFCRIRTTAHCLSLCL